MNIAEIRAAVTALCGRTNSEFTSQIDSWINDTVKERLMLKNDLWFMEYYGTIPTVAAQRNYNLPSLFKNELKDGVVYRDSNGSSFPLDLTNEAEARKDYTTDQVGPPEAIVLKGDTYDVWPLPDGIYNIDWAANLFLAPLSDANISNTLSDEYPNAYIYAGAYKGFGFLEEYERATYYENEMEKVIDNITYYDVLRKCGNIDLTASANALSTRKRNRTY